jgi:toxin ParE1/3/4
VPRPIYLTSARQDFRDILRYITHESGSLTIGRGFVAKLREKCDQLSALPGLLGTARPELRSELRSTPFGSYVIFFRYVGNRIEIVNILNAGRDAGRVLNS